MTRHCVKWREICTSFSLTIVLPRRTGTAPAGMALLVSRWSCHAVSVLMVVVKYCVCVCVCVCARVWWCVRVRQLGCQLELLSEHEMSPSETYFLIWQSENERDVKMIVVRIVTLTLHGVAAVSCSTRACAYTRTSPSLLKWRRAG
jgi:hypothetical protein